MQLFAAVLSRTCGRVFRKWNWKAMSNEEKTAGKTARVGVHGVRRFRENRIVRVPRRMVITRIAEDALKVIDREARKWRSTRGEIVAAMVRRLEASAVTQIRHNFPPCALSADVVSYWRLGEQEVRPLPRTKSRNPKTPICPPLWVYASAHRSDPIRRGLYHAQWKSDPMRATKETAGKTARVGVHGVRRFRENRIVRVPLRMVITRIAEDALEVIDREARKWRSTRGEVVAAMVRRLEAYAEAREYRDWLDAMELKGRVAFGEEVRV